MVTSKCLPAVRQADELATRRVAVPRQTIAVITMESRTRPSLSARASFFLHLESVAVADIDRAVGAPFPAAVINVEMMAMAVMTMPMMMTMAMPVVPVMAVTSTVAAMPTVTAMLTVTASESLTRDGQGRGGQRQSSDRGRNDLLDLRHGRLLDGAERGSPCDDPLLEAPAAVRCDQDHAIGRIAQLV